MSDTTTINMSRTAEAVERTIQVTAPHCKDCGSDEVGSQRLNLSWLVPAGYDPTMYYLHYFVAVRDFASAEHLIYKNWVEFPDLYQKLNSEWW